jgi:hypothetical protein
MNLLLFLQFFDRLSEGGPGFMYPLLIMLLVCLYLLGRAFLKGDPNEKNRKLVAHISLFALAWGFLGNLVGLIVAFDTIGSVNGDIATPVMANGLKIGLLSPTFGIVVFLIARLGIIGLVLKKK